MRTAMRRAARLISIAALMLGIGLVSAGQAAAATTTVRYGPYTIPAASSGEMGQLRNRVQFGVSRPCNGCFITSMRANLVSAADGSTVNVDDGLMLHHMVLTSQFRPDATCTGRPKFDPEDDPRSPFLGFAGERFFASGNERTVVQFPPGYGYRISSSFGQLGTERWNLIYDLMNMMPEPQTVYIEVTFTHQSASSGLEPVKPVWLDIDQCGDSEYTVPSGVSDTHWDWKVNVPGHMVAMGGHVHTESHGLRIEATNQTTGASICNSVATYGGTPDYFDMDGMPWISSMSTCIADPVATVASGDVVRIHSVYDNPGPPDPGAMGIMLAYVHRH